MLLEAPMDRWVLKMIAHKLAAEHLVHSMTANASMSSLYARLIKGYIVRRGPAGSNSAVARKAGAGAGASEQMASDICSNEDKGALAADVDAGLHPAVPPAAEPPRAFLG